MGENICFQNICRICTNGTGGISIYSEEGKKCSLQEKIKKFLSITVSEEDILPKMVCLLCTSKLESIDQFASMALKMQTKLLDCLNAQSSGHPLIDELKSANEATDQLEQQSSDESTSSNEESNFEAKPNDENILETKDFQGSLLHSILMKGSGNVGDVTEMEVKVDPMLFLGEDDPPSDQDSLKSSSTQEGDWKRKEEEEEMVDFKPYQCALCPRGFNSDLSLQSHLWNHLPPSRKLLVTSALSRIQPPPKMHREKGLREYASSQCLCQVCGRVYPTRSTLRAHQITHSNLRPHKCSLCDKTFKRNQDLKFHINQHTGERPYRCPYCPKAFASSGNCFSHRKRMHPKQLDRDKKAANA